MYTQPDKPKGRGHKLQPPPVKELALQHNIPVFQPVNLRGEDTQREIQAWGADVIVVVAYGKLLPKAVLDAPRLGCVNVHGSLLPKYRGPRPSSGRCSTATRRQGSPPCSWQRAWTPATCS